MNINKEVGLVLEGGGVKCAYQLGAMMALEEMGYHFKAISGASFGALNGALYIEGGIKKLFDYYNNLKTKDIFVDDNLCDFINNYNGDKSSFLNAFLAFIKDHQGSFSSDREAISYYYQSYVAHLVNEEAVNKSPIDFMFSVLEVENNPLLIPLIATCYFSRNLGPLYLNETKGTISSKIVNKLDCNKGTLAHYVAASANYPFFKPLEVEGKYYLDGGILNNVPYQILLDEGYQNIIIIRTKTDELQGKIPQNENILQILPTKNLGSSLVFTHDNIMELIKLGYQDCKNQIKE